MRPDTWRDWLRQHIIWGSWPWLTFGFYHGNVLVVSKLKVIFERRR